MTLGIDKLILLNRSNSHLKLDKLKDDTQEYFKKLPGFDTLRLLLAKKVILVEGPSDELIVQKAYCQEYKKLPIEDGIDVITVRGLSFKRFLEIAKHLSITVSVVTDNDGDIEKVKEKYKDYININTIRICYDDNISSPTLEPQLVKINELSALNSILGRNESDENALIDYMTKNKTECALKIFESEKEINIPEYIKNAIK